jgi:hypothetical protein
MCFSKTEIARLALRAANTEACAKARDATECNPIEREIDSWDEGIPASVHLAYCNYGGVETRIHIKQDFGDGVVSDVVLFPDDISPLIRALLATQFAIKTLNEAAENPGAARERYEIEKQLANNPGFLDDGDDGWRAEAERRWGPKQKPDLHIVLAE